MFVESQDPHQIRLVNEEDLPGKDIRNQSSKAKKFWKKKGTEARLEVEWN